jgi:hypothetical protein
VRDKLLFEQEYAGSIREKVPPRSSLHIPWSWLPAALCVLQEVTQMLLLKKSKYSSEPLNGNYQVYFLYYLTILHELEVARL